MCSSVYLDAFYLLTVSHKLELSMVQENVSNQVIGKMRFQFWRDAVSSIAEVLDGYVKDHTMS